MILVLLIKQISLIKRTEQVSDFFQTAPGKLLSAFQTLNRINFSLFRNTLLHNITILLILPLNVDSICNCMTELFTIFKADFSHSHFFLRKGLVESWSVFPHFFLVEIHYGTILRFLCFHDYRVYGGVDILLHGIRLENRLSNSLAHLWEALWGCIQFQFNFLKHSSLVLIDDIIELRVIVLDLFDFNVIFWYTLLDNFIELVLFLEQIDLQSFEFSQEITDFFGSRILMVFLRVGLFHHEYLETLASQQNGAFFAVE